jgi:hypothetical protein
MKFIYLIPMVVIILFPLSFASSELSYSNVIPSPSLPEYSDQSIRTLIVTSTDIKTIRMPLFNSTMSIFEQERFYENSKKFFELQSTQLSDASDRLKNMGVLISSLGSAPVSSGNLIKFVRRIGEQNSNNSSVVAMNIWNEKSSQSLNDEIYDIKGGFEFAPRSLPIATNNFKEIERGMVVRWGY